MRIVHVSYRYPPAIGGAERWCAGLARWQVSGGHQVTVLTLRAVDEDELWEDTPPLGSVAVGVSDCDAGVGVRRCAPERPGQALRVLLDRLGLGPWTGALSAELFGLLLRAAHASDIVHAHTLPVALPYLAWLAARLARRPFVLTPHFHAGDPVYEHASVRWLLRRADRVLVLTEAERAALAARGARRRRVVVAATAVDAKPPHERSRDAVRAALDLPAESPLLCFVGRKTAPKGIDVLFNALPLIRHRPVPVLVMAGPATAWYRALRPPSCAVQVVELPALSESAKTQLLAASDLFVLPSSHEAFGIVFLEAWVAGAPVLGANIAAVREAVGDAGSLFRPDDPLDLAARIDAILSHPAEAARQVARGRARIAAAHTWDHVGAAVEAVYHDALAERRRRARGLRRESSEARVAR